MDEVDGAGSCGLDDSSSPGVDVDLVLLDAEIRSILNDPDLDANEKWIHYYLTVERYLYKRNPRYKPSQFRFKSHTERCGRVRYSVKDPPWYHRWRKYAFLSSLIGPLIGAVCSAWIRSREWCC